MKRLIRKILSKLGYRISKIKNEKIPVGSLKRPVGNVFSFMEDIKARGFKAKQILDVGAYNGSWSRYIHPIFPKSKYHLIEPQFDLEPSLISISEEFKNFSYTIAGAASKKGEMILTTMGSKDGSTFTIEENEDLIKAGKQKKVAITTIDELIENGVIDVPDIIKADVQGLEIDVLKGAKKAMGKTELIILEVSFFPFGPEVHPFPLIREVAQFMCENGYEIYDFSNFARRPFDGALGQCDICFALKDGFLRKHKGYN